MKKILLLSIVLFAFGNLQAQDAKAADKKEEKKEGWFRSAAIGLDFGQLAMINPKVGAGENRINIGGAASVGLNYKKGRIAWDNGAATIFGVQKLGTGTLLVGATQKAKPFQKSADELRLNSKLGYSLKQGGKWFAAADFSFLSQLTPTYDGNYMSDFTGKGAIAQFLSPAIATFAVGIDYKATPKLSFFYSPISWRAVMVADDGIGQFKLAAGKTVRESFGIPNADKSNQKIGSLLRGVYADKFFKDKLVYSSNLALFSAYKFDPFNVKVDWANQLGWQLAKGFQLSLGVNAFYDRDILVQISDKNAPGGVSGLGRKVSFVQQLLLKYGKTF